MSVYKKLQEARSELHKLPLKKSGHNKFAGYSYFELGDFLPQSQLIFNELGLCGIVTFTPEIATLTIYEVDGDGQITFTSPMGSAALKGCHEVQNIGAVETYQRRYLYVAALEIVEHDAIDSSPQIEKKTALPKAVGVTAGLVATYNFSEEEKTAIREVTQYIRDAFSDGRIMDAHDEFYAIEDNEVKTAVWHELKSDSRIRTAIKKYHEGNV